MKYRIVKRDCSFEGDAKFQFVFQVDNGMEWVDIQSFNEEMLELLQKAEWESPNELERYINSQNYVYSGN